MDIGPSKCAYSELRAVKSSLGLVYVERRTWCDDVTVRFTLRRVLDMTHEGISFCVRKGEFGT